MGGNLRYLHCLRPPFGLGAAINLDELWQYFKAKRDEAAAIYGRGSNVTRSYERDLRDINARRLRRDMRKRKAA